MGLRENSKTYDVLNYLEGKNADIICLQDTHLMESDAFDLKKQWKGNFILQGVRHNARGVAILHADKDNEGNML